MHKPGKQPWWWLIILTTSLAIIFATIPASYKCLKCMNCGRRSLNDHETCCTWDKWPIQSHRPRSDYGNRPGVVKFVMIRNAHAENYEFVSFPEMRTSAITMQNTFFLKQAISLCQGRVLQTHIKLLRVWIRKLCPAFNSSYKTTF